MIRGCSICAESSLPHSRNVAVACLRGLSILGIRARACERCFKEYIALYDSIGGCDGADRVGALRALVHNVRSPDRRYALLSLAVFIGVCAWPFAKRRISSDSDLLVCADLLTSWLERASVGGDVLCQSFEDCVRNNGYLGGAADGVGRVRDVIRGLGARHEAVRISSVMLLRRSLDPSLFFQGDDWLVARGQSSSSVVGSLAWMRWWDASGTLLQDGEKDGLSRAWSLPVPWIRTGDCRNLTLDLVRGFIANLDNHRLFWETNALGIVYSAFNAERPRHVVYELVKASPTEQISTIATWLDGVSSRISLVTRHDKELSLHVGRVCDSCRMLGWRAV